MVMSTPEHQPGTYRKGDRVRVATTAKEAVQLVWEGYQKVEDGEAQAAQSTNVETNTNETVEPKPESVNDVSDGGPKAKQRQRG